MVRSNAHECHAVTRNHVLPSASRYMLPYTLRVCLAGAPSPRPTCTLPVGDVYLLTYLPLAMSERRRRAEGGRGTLRRTRSRAGIQACGAGTTEVTHRARRRRPGTHAPTGGSGKRQTGTRPKPWTPTTDASHAAGRVGAPRRGARRRPSPWNAPALPCYRARRGGGRDAGGIGPVHRRARRRAPTAGNAKTHSTPSRDDGVEHK